MDSLVGKKFGLKSKNGKYAEHKIFDEENYGTDFLIFASNKKGEGFSIGIRQFSKLMDNDIIRWIV